MKSKLRISTLGLIILAGLMVFFSSCKKDDDPVNEQETFTDSRDGKVYKYVKIGEQTWMAENFAYKPTDGFWAYNNDEGNVSGYGYLYTLETAKNICPAGWHVPNLDEWNTLIDYLGGTELAGNKMKETGGAHWDSNAYGNKNISNSSGFSARPGGRYDGAFSEFEWIGIYGFWWIIPENPDANYTKVVDLSGSYPDIEIQDGSTISGFSVRYIKD
jgi:uncharacterized protein (TIGR02145 family)